jgi:SAM-dependent methyltransferase
MQPKNGTNHMELSFPRYLLAKQSVDDRALNRGVLTDLQNALATWPTGQALRVVEVGAGIGTMLARLLRWGVLPPQVEYTLVDEMQENIDFAHQWLAEWGAHNGFHVESSPDGLHFSASKSVLHIRLFKMDVFDFIDTQAESRYDLLVAHAFLDLLPMPESLLSLFGLLKPEGLAWMTVNFDGVTSLEPVLDPALDSLIERLYHQSMDSRPGGGDSQSGRHLFGHIEQAGGKIVSAGASDWVVYPLKGQYPAEEAYFLHFILHFFESSLGGHPQLDAGQFADWLARRREQIEQGKLVYIAHQMDFLARKKQPV